MYKQNQRKKKNKNGKKGKTQLTKDQNFHQSAH